jgi:hypothetical protein
MTWRRFFDIAEKKRQIVSMTRSLVQLQNRRADRQENTAGGKSPTVLAVRLKSRKKPGRRAFAESVRTGEIFAVEAGFLHLCMTY